ncbi:universal stress protein [Mycobacterium sp. NPDC050551]|uniref:universal stress protein n=1 Tax=Mycobacterium sp. NPDC050551 TaxID=3155407 RepID=UPI003428F6D9
MPENTLPIVVGIDGSDGSLRAVQWAAAVATRRGSPLHLLHSTSTAGHFISDAAIIAIKAAAAADHHAAAEKFLTIARDTVAERFPDLTVDVEVVSEPADQALIRLSRTAGLIVVGCDDVNRAVALLLGSTSLAVSTHAQCPAVVWRDVPQPSKAPVVVGVDGTAAGTAALASAFDFADLFGAPVRAVHSWSTGLGGDQVTFPYLIDWAAIETAEWALLRAAVKPWQQRYPRVRVEYFVEVGKPSSVLLDRCTDAQLVVVGDHRTNVVSATLLGSTSLNLLHHSFVPVVVCRPEKGS